MKYKTKNKELVLNCFKEHVNQHLTVDEIFNLLDKSVPLASLYRSIDSLVEEEIIRKYIIDSNSPASYQYIGEACHDHFHLLCEKCGKIIHLECHEVEHLINHIQKEHGFKVNRCKVNLYGICEDCQKKGRKI